MISYEPLWRTMEEKKITTYMLISDYGFNSQTISRLRHGKGITIYTLDRLCEVLDCTPNDILCHKKSGSNTTQ